MAGRALAGEPQTVAARFDECRRISIDSFIFSGYPHLEEANSVGGLVLPMLPMLPTIWRGDVAVTLGPSGTTVAGDRQPRLRAAQ